MADDVLVNKAAAIERAVRRVREEHAGDDRNLLENQTRQDAILLNLQRACETSIDAAMQYQPSAARRRRPIRAAARPGRAVMRPAATAGSP